MSFVAVAIGGAALVGAGASMAAADKQSKAAGQAGNMTMDQYRQNQRALAPWTDTGKSANTNLATRLGLATSGGPDWDAYLRDNPDVAANAFYGNDPAGHYTRFGKSEGRALPMLQAGGNATDPQFGSLLAPYTGESLTSDPGYQFGLSEGEKGINRMAAAGSGRDSGSTMKALLRYNEDYAGTKFNEGFNRDQASKGSIYSMLSGQSGQGVNAAGMTAGLGANAAGQASGALMQGADAGAAGVVGATNSLTNGVGSYLQYNQNQSMLDYLKNLRGGYLSSGTAPAAQRM